MTKRDPTDLKGERGIGHVTQKTETDSRFFKHKMNTNIFRCSRTTIIHFLAI